MVFTGHETKIMMNSVKSKAKFTRLERATNRYIGLLVLVQIFICLCASLFNAIWTLKMKDHLGYLCIGDIVLWKEIISGFGTWFLRFSNFVPISLMVTLEVVKFF